MHVRVLVAGVVVALAFSTVAALGGERFGLLPCADMELSDDPPADYEASAPEISDDPPADAQPSAPEISDDPPASYERSAPDISDDPPSEDF